MCSDLQPTGPGCGSRAGGDALLGPSLPEGFPFQGCLGRGQTLLGGHVSLSRGACGQGSSSGLIPAQPRGEQLIPFPGGWELVPANFVSICLSPHDPPKMVVFEWQFHTNLRKLWLSTTALPSGAGRRTALLPLLHQPVPACSLPWKPTGCQGEGAQMRSPSLRAAPGCPSTSFPSPSPVTTSLPLKITQHLPCGTQPGHPPTPAWAPRGALGHPSLPCAPADPASHPQASGTAPSASSCGTASGARRRPWRAPCASPSSRARSTSWAGSPRGRCTTRSW